MAITKRTVVVSIKVQTDGQVIVYEWEEYWEGEFDSGVMEATGPRTGRILDVGADVTTETDLVKDVVNGNLHSQARIDDRAAEKAAELAL